MYLEKFDLLKNIFTSKTTPS